MPNLQQIVLSKERVTLVDEHGIKKKDVRIPRFLSCITLSSYHNVDGTTSFNMGAIDCSRYNTWMPNEVMLASINARAPEKATYYLISEPHIHNEGVKVFPVIYFAPR